MKEAAIRTIDDGFEIVRSQTKQQMFISWHDIVKVRCYKRDLVTTDELCIAVTFLKNQMPWTQDVSEELEGFEEFVAQLSKHVKLSPAEWRSLALAVPFARSELTLFDKT
jgi:hypothetical protein